MKKRFWLISAVAGIHGGHRLCTVSDPGHGGREGRPEIPKFVLRAIVGEEGGSRNPPRSSG